MFRYHRKPLFNVIPITPSYPTLWHNPRAVDRPDPSLGLPADKGPHLGKDIGAVPVVAVRLAVVGGEVGASQYGACGGTVFLCAFPLAVFARAAC